MQLPKCRGICRADALVACLSSHCSHLKVRWLFLEVPSKTKAQPSSAVCEDKGHEREVHPPAWSASLGAIHHTREMSASPSGSGGDVETPRSRRLHLGVTNPILLELVLLKLTQSFRLVGETYHSETGQKKKKKKASVTCSGMSFKTLMFHLALLV